MTGTPRSFNHCGDARHLHPMHEREAEHGSEHHPRLCSLVAVFRSRRGVGIACASGARVAPRACDRQGCRHPQTPCQRTAASSHGLVEHSAASQVRRPLHPLEGGRTCCLQQRVLSVCIGVHRFELFVDVGERGPDLISQRDQLLPLRRWHLHLWFPCSRRFCAQVLQGVAQRVEPPHLIARRIEHLLLR